MTTLDIDFKALAIRLAGRDQTDEPDEERDRLLAETYPEEFVYSDGEGLTLR